MLTEKENSLLLDMDYQILNNGMDGWLSNHRYRDVFTYLAILRKRNSELDQKVASIFENATVAGLEYLQYKDSTFIPEFKENYDSAEKTLEKCGEQYKEAANMFMSSYGLEDYLTRFSRGYDETCKGDD